MARTLQDVLSQITREGIKNVRFEFLDMNAIARSKTIPSRHFKEEAEHGSLFAVLCFLTDTVGEVATESDLFKKYLYADLTMFPDLSTFITLPWAKNTARVYVSGTSVSATGDELMIDPKMILGKQIQSLAEKGLSIFSAFEYEFWVLDGKSREPITDDHHFFVTLSQVKHQEFLDKVAENLFGVGVDVRTVETESARGQFEITVKPAFGIRAADDAATIKTGIKEMAIQEGFLASFMTRPYPDENGGSAHLNHSLWSVDGKTSKMSDPSRPYGLSEIAEYWVAGLIEHAPALSFLQSPTLNCRERCKPGLFAPFNVSWGIDNRSCAVRVKLVGAHGIYLENRIGASAGNPYISLAATIAAGIDGINRRLSLPPSQPFNKVTKENDDTTLLPTTFENAIEAVKSDQVMMKAIGDDVINAIEHIRLTEKKKMGSADKYDSYRKLYLEFL